METIAQITPNIGSNIYTLAQSGTRLLANTPVLVNGEGSDITDKQALKKRA